LALGARSSGGAEGIADLMDRLCSELREHSCRITDRGKNHFTFIKAGWNKPSATNRIYNAVRTGRIKIEEQRGSLVPY
jgi:hypothetical protein